MKVDYTKATYAVDLFSEETLHDPDMEFFDGVVHEAHDATIAAMPAEIQPEDERFN